MSKALENIVRGVAGTVIVGGTAAAALATGYASAIGAYSAVKSVQNGESGLFGALGALVFGYAAWKIGNQIPAMIRTFTGRETYDVRR